MNPSWLLLATLAACRGVEVKPEDALPTQKDPARPGAPPSEQVEVPLTGGVVLSGTFAYTGSSTGSYRIDVQKLGSDGRSSIAKALTLGQQGPWEVELPKDFGEVIVTGFIDAADDGPSAGEPSVTYYGVTIGAEPVGGIALVPVEGGAIIGSPPASAPAPLSAIAGAQVDAAPGAVPAGAAVPAPTSKLPEEAGSPGPKPPGSEAPATQAPGTQTSGP